MFQQTIQNAINAVCDVINRSYCCSDNILGQQLWNRKGGAEKFLFRGFFVRFVTIAQKFYGNFYLQI